MWGAFSFLGILLTSPVLSFSYAGPLVSPPTFKAALHKKMSVRNAASAAETEPPAQPVDGGGPKSAADLVTKMLGKIEGTNRGIDCTGSERDSIDRIIEQLNTLGEDKEWLKDPKVFGNYNVATDEMFQHLVEPATAVNMIVFRAFGILRGCVTLRGQFEAMPDRPNFVEASFEPPLVNFLGKRGLTVQSGPKSSVKLAATYVDDRIRLGKGGRGSLFVFTRGGPAETSLADEWKVYAAASARPVKARALGAAAACGAVVAAVRSAFLPAAVLASLSAMLVVTQLGADGDSKTPDNIESGATAA